MISGVYQLAIARRTVLGDWCELRKVAEMCHLHACAAQRCLYLLLQVIYAQQRMTTF